MKKCGLDKNPSKFDFNALIKVPQELENTAVPVKVVETDEDARKLYIGYRYNVHVPMGTVLAITKEEAARRSDLYGATDWYRFRVNNWGTKWQPCNVEVHEKVLDKEMGHIIVSFDTAWTPAEPIARFLEKDGLVITGAYIEKGCDIKGYYLNNQGDFYFEEYEDEHGCSYSIEW